MSVMEYTAAIYYTVERDGKKVSFVDEVKTISDDHECEEFESMCEDDLMQLWDDCLSDLNNTSEMDGTPVLGHLQHGKEYFTEFKVHIYTDQSPNMYGEYDYDLTLTLIEHKEV